MSIAMELLNIIKGEMEKHGVSKLTKIRVVHGKLSGVVPDSLAFAFEVLTKDTPLESAELELAEQPVKLKCGQCSVEFEPEDTSMIMLMPCPECQEEVGHEVLSGKELYLDKLEVETNEEK
jgi:hydrogenase nickel incorporation protein HypA/HybF